MNKKNISAGRFSETFFPYFYLAGWVGCFILLSSGLYAQEIDPARPQILIDLAQNDGSGIVEISQPPQVEKLLKLQIANNHLQKGIPGYRIHIFSLSGQTARQKAEEAKATFMRNFPDTEAVLEYNEPNYQIFVGNYRTKNEAWRQYKQIAKMFPRAFVVSEIIDIPK